MEKEEYSKEYITNQIEFLFRSHEGFKERFDFFSQHIDSADKQHLLISGSAVGAELIIAKELDFKRVTGVEISNYYKVTADIFTKDLGVETVLYDGEILPFEDNYFSMAISGHVIEHTTNPKVYLSELSRVLRNNSVLFIEFPDRNHFIELHTETRSYEKYPTVVRNAILKTLEISPFVSVGDKEKYKSVRKTLKQISERDINKIFKELDVGYKILKREEPAPGILLLLYRINRTD